MSARKQITLSLPTELVDSLDLAARDRCVGRKLLIEMLLTQGLRRLMPADSYMFGVELRSAAPEPCTTCGGSGWVDDDPNAGPDGSQSGCPTCTVPGECGGRGYLSEW